MTTPRHPRADHQRAAYPENPRALSAEPPGDLMACELRKRWRELHAGGEEAQRLVAGLTSHQFWWRPAEDRWSVAECLAHVVLAGEAYHEVIDPAVASARARGLRAEGRRDVGAATGSRLGDLLMKGLEPPARLRIPAPARIRPARPSDPGDAAAAAPRAPGSPLARFLALRHAHADRLRAADGLALDRVRVRSPFVPLVTVNLDTALRILTGHERRHLWQAWQVRQHPGFPRRAAAGAA